MKFNFIFYFTFVVLNPALLSQSFPEQDCIYSIPIEKDSFFQSTPYIGTGNISNEINQDFSCLITGERNGAWYSYCVKTSGDLCFSLIPVDGNDDFDWAVYNLTNAVCSDIFYDSTLEISCNFSSIPGVTGANNHPGSQNNPCIQVTAGEKYVINISQFSPSGSGYTLYFNSSSSEPELNCNYSDSCSLEYAFIIQDALCKGDSSGSANLLITSGSYPYLFQWSNGQTSNVIQGLSAGSYYVTITDSIGCTYEKQIAIQEPEILSTIIYSYPVSSDSTCNGEGLVIADGGTPPYSFQWNAGSQWSSNDMSGAYLCAGTYYVTVTDTNGCQKIDSVTVLINSIEEYFLNRYYEIYPNPSYGEFTFRSSNLREEIIKIEIQNLTGKIIFQQMVISKSFQIDLASHPPGMYFIKVLEKDFISYLRVIKLKK